MQSTPIHELRLDSRNNIFVMAALYSSGRSVTPVRVRNISRTGALIEAASLPLPGSAVRLTRANLSATGTMIWIDDCKAGVQFDMPVEVASWLPQGRRGIGQQFVDELFHQKRLGVRHCGSQPHNGNRRALSEDLLELRVLLESAGEELVLDGVVATRHAGALQAIHSAAQILARLAAEATVREVTVAAAASG